MAPEQFEAAVEDALAALPEEILAHLDNIAITVEDEPSATDCDSVGIDPERDLLFGLYHGTPLPEREFTTYGELPDRIAIYRLPLLEACRNRRELLREIRDTVIHEVGHYFGFDEEELP